MELLCTGDFPTGISQPAYDGIFKLNGSTKASKKALALYTAYFPQDLKSMLCNTQVFLLLQKSKELSCLLDRSDSILVLNSAQQELKFLLAMLQN